MGLKIVDSRDNMSTSSLTELTAWRGYLTYKVLLSFYLMFGVYANGNGKTTFVKAATLGHYHKPVNTSIIFDYDPTTEFNLAIFRAFFAKFSIIGRTA